MIHCTSWWRFSFIYVCVFPLPPDVKAKVSSSPFLKCATQFPLILWHPYTRHYYFCAATEKEQEKWHAVFQDCIRHTNNGESLSTMMQCISNTCVCVGGETVKTFSLMCLIICPNLSNVFCDPHVPRPLEGFSHFIMTLLCLQ